MSGGSSAVAPSLSQSLAYALFTALAYPVLTMFGVTLLSLTTGSSPPERREATAYLRTKRAQVRSRRARQGRPTLGASGSAGGLDRKATRGQRQTLCSKPPPPVALPPRPWVDLGSTPER
jgi:hypothetical protein